jgi:hypothetical protein
MTPRHHSLKSWTVAFENAAWGLLADYLRGDNRDSYQVHAEPCLDHGSECVCVVYGALLDHLNWADHEPRELAARLVATMLPPVPSEH